MRHTVRPALVAPALLVTAMLVTSCSTTVPGSPTPAAPAAAAPAAGGDPVTWINGVCGSLLGFVKTVSTAPAVDSASPEKTISGLSAYLGGAVTAIDTAMSGMKGAGPSPVAGGDQAVTSITGDLGTFRTSFQSAKTKIDAVNLSDVGQVATALPEAVAPLQDLSKMSTSSDLKSTPELDRAAQQAPNCQALSTSSG